jgi:hypothetical protein
MGMQERGSALGERVSTLADSYNVRQVSNLRGRRLPYSGDDRTSGLPAFITTDNWQLTTDEPGGSRKIDRARIFWLQLPFRAAKMTFCLGSLHL